jgi:hypothetical protein
MYILDRGSNILHYTIPHSTIRTRVNGLSLIVYVLPNITCTYLCLFDLSCTHIYQTGPYAWCMYGTVGWPCALRDGL